MRTHPPLQIYLLKPMLSVKGNEIQLQQLIFHILIMDMRQVEAEDFLFTRNLDLNAPHPTREVRQRNPHIHSISNCQLPIMIRVQNCRCFELAFAG